MGQTARLAVVLFATAAYTAVLPWALALAGPSAETLAVLPVLAAAWCWDLRFSLLFAGVLTLVLNPVLRAATGPATLTWIDLLPGALPGFVAALLIVFIVGLVRSTSVQLQHELVERNRAEEALRARRRQYRQLVDHASDLIYWADPDGFFTEVNPTAAQIMGYSAEELVGTNYLDLIRPDHQEEALAFYVKQRDERIPSTYYEFPAVAKDGREVWVGQHVQLILRDGQVAGVQAVARDITKRRKAEHALQVSEEQYRNLFESASDSILIFDPDSGEIMEANQRACRLYGYDKGELLGRSLMDFSRNPEQGAQQIRTVLERRQVSGYETTHLRRDGTPVHLLVSGSLIEYHGRPAVLSINRDITDRKKAEGLQAGQKYLLELIAAGKPLREILETLIFFMEAFAPGNACAIQLVDPDGHRPLMTVAPSLKASYLVQTGELELFPKSVISLSSVHPDERLQVSDIRVDERWTSVREAALGHGFTTCWSAPIISKDKQILGALVMLLQDDRDPAAADRRLVDVATQLAGIAVERKRADEALRYREAILEAAGFAAEQFLRAPAWESGIEGVLARLGQATDASRVSIFRNETDGAGSLRAESRFTWTAPDVASRPQRPVYTTVPYDDAGLGRWMETLRTGRPIYGSVASLPEEERGLLHGQGVHSIVVMPIFTSGSWWGLICLDDCDESRTVSEMEIEALRVVANTLGAAIQRRHQEQALKESEAKYRSVVEAVKDIVFQTDVEGRWTFLNAAWTESTGYTLEESLGRAYDVFVHPDDRPLIEEQFRPLLDRSQSVCRSEVRCLTKEGDVRWMELFARLATDKVGNVVGTSGTLHDVTERRTALLTLQHALEKERELNELKSRFVAMASHELRTPLATIHSSAELVGRFRHRWEEEKIDVHLQRIERNVRNMTALLDDVLLLGRAEAGRLPFNPGPLEVRAFVADLAEEIQLGVGEGHHIETFFPEGPVDAELDSRLLRTILHNLFSNAVKYSEPGSTVRLVLERDPICVIFTVIDEGIGIPQADMARLFEPFHRAGNVGARRGTGLGLSIVKRAVDLHGGHIRLESREGVGTTYIVSLPVTQAQRSVSADA